MKNYLFVRKINYPFPLNVCAFFGGEAPTKFKNLVSNFYSPNVKDKRFQFLQSECRGQKIFINYVC